MKTIRMKKGLVGAVLVALMLTLVGATVVTTATGCLVCRDCGPRPYHR